MEKTSAIILAVDDTNNRDLAPLAAHKSKPLIPLKGRPAIAYVVENLRNCDHIGKIILVGTSHAYEAVPIVDEFVAFHDDEASSAIDGIRAAQDSQRCLLMNGDMALAEPEPLSDFLAAAPMADLVYPIVEKSDVKDVFPGKTAYYVKTREGQFTGAGCLLFNPHSALSREDLLVQLVEGRKNPQSLLGLLGAGFALRVMLSTLSLRDFESHLSTVLGLDCRVFISHYPELMMSIDSVEDIHMIESELS